MGDKVNIAIIAGQLVVGGAERQLYLWLSNLNRERFNPMVITLHPGHADYWETPIEQLDIPLIRVRQRANRIIRLIEIIKILHQYKPDLIHGWHLFSSVYAGMAAKVLHTQCIGGIRNTYQTFSEHRVEAWLALHTVDTFITNSNNASQYLKKHINPKRQEVFTVQNAIIDNFIDRQEIRAKLVSDYGIPEDRLWILTIGRMDFLKRFDLLIKVISDLIQSGSPIHCLLIGDGPERQNLEFLAKELGASDHVTFTGEIPGAASWLKAADIFAFTSLDEGMPNVIMEAAAAGLPIVTWRLPFYEELLENTVSALLVEPENIGAMKDAIMKLIASPELRASLGQTARSHILKSFSLQAYVQKMTEVYEAVLTGQEIGSNEAE